MQVYRSGSGPTDRAPEATFAGRGGGAHQRLLPARGAEPLGGRGRHLLPGRTHPFKTNPSGQTLVVTSGVGWAQCEGGDIVEVRAGDVIWCPPRQRHWEGATSDQTMTYFAMHEDSVSFGDRVTDGEYLQGPSAALGS